MQYENRQPTEGINVSKKNPLKQFLVLLTSVILLVLAVLIVFTFLGGWLARFVPFSAEVSMVEAVGIDFDEMFESDTDDPVFIQREKELNELASRVMAHMDLPSGMDITVHYVDDDVFNAFATLGGHVFFYRGLIEQMPHENALSMVMAHEIAHELHRDPISGLGGGVSAQVAMSAIFGGSNPLSPVLDMTSIIGGASFTRGMESRADLTAIAAVNSLYGHVAGADGLFHVLAKQSVDDEELPNWAETFLLTHPLSQDRIDAIKATAEKNGWLVVGDTTPLSDALVNMSATAPATD